MSSIFFSNWFYDYISLITSFFLSPFKNNCAFIGGTCCSPYLFPCPFSFSISFLLLFLWFAFPCKFACLQANFTRIRQTTNSPKWVQYCPGVVLVVASPVAAIIAMLAIVKCGRRCWCRMLHAACCRLQLFGQSPKFRRLFKSSFGSTKLASPACPASVLSI